MTPTANLFLLGAPKCGTTSLVRYLSMHPQVFAPRVKEPQYFATDFPRRVVGEHRDYIGLYKAATGQHRWRLDASTIYMSSATAVGNILRTESNPRFIVMVRDPLTMLPSWHNQMLIRFFEDQQSFETAWGMISDRRSGKRIPARCPYPPFLFYDTIARYNEQITRLLDLVPSKYVHVVIFDDFISNTFSAFQSVLAFLGIERNHSFDQLRVENARRTWRYAALAKLAGSPMVRRARLAARMRVNGNEPYLQWLFRPAAANHVSQSVIEAVRLAYVDDVEALRSLLQAPLSSWLSGSASLLDSSSG